MTMATGEELYLADGDIITAAVRGAMTDWDAGLAFVAVGIGSEAGRLVAVCPSCRPIRRRGGLEHESGCPSWRLALRSVACGVAS